MTCEGGPMQTLHPSPGDARVAYLLRRRHHQFLFSTWTTCVDYERRRDGSVGETIFYCQHSRITRGVYWLLRPLSFVSVALLAVALLSIACNSGTRRKVHGWCLASYGACLLAYNAGQVAYYLTISYEIDSYSYVPFHLINTCQKIALPMYFLLMSANTWRTALCFNMFLGFGKLQVARGEGKDWRRFMALSVFAWGLPALMTGICASAFEKDHLSRKWYSTSLSETRTCYTDIHIGKIYKTNEGNGMERRTFSNYKAGTKLSFDVPVYALATFNLLCITQTFKTIEFLQRGSSVLHREENRLRQRERGNQSTTNIAEREAARTPRSDPKLFQLFMKMLLMTGLIETILETAVWDQSVFSSREPFSLQDHALPHRAAGYVADCFRAACVAWLAAPDGGYLEGLRRRLCAGDGERGADPGGARVG